MKPILAIALLIVSVSCSKQTTKPSTTLEAKEQSYSIQGRYLRTYTIIDGEVNGAFQDSVIITTDKVYIDYNGKGVVDEILSYVIENNKFKVKNRVFDIASSKNNLRLSETKSRGLVVEGWVMVR
jgi:hypothetical protein